jgi:hypothetical protein
MNPLIFTLFEIGQLFVYEQLEKRGQIKLGTNFDLG